MVDRITTIGIGGDYASVNTWLADTSYNLFLFQTREIGECLDQMFIEASQAIFSGATTSSVYYRYLRAKDEPFDQRTGKGPLISFSDTNGMVVSENYVRMRGIGVFTQALTTSRRCFVVQSGYVGIEIDDCTGFISSLVTNSASFRVQSPSKLVNCLAVSDALVNVDGFAIQTADSTLVHCTSYGHFRSAFSVSTAGAGSLLTNCVGSSVGNDFTAFPGTATNCASVDGTAPGTGAVTASIADMWIDPLVNDFRPRVALRGAGVDAGVTEDLLGVPRETPPAIGAFAPVQVPAYLAGPSVEVESYQTYYGEITNGATVNLVTTPSTGGVVELVWFRKEVSSGTPAYSGEIILNDDLDQIFRLPGSDAGQPTESEASAHGIALKPDSPLSIKASGLDAVTGSGKGFYAVTVRFN